MVDGCDSRTVFPKYLEYFGKLVPTKNEATMSSAHMPGVARTDLGERSAGIMKRLHLPGAARTNFPKYHGIFGKAVRENERKCDEQVSRFRFPKYSRYFGKAVRESQPPTIFLKYSEYFKNHFPKYSKYFGKCHRRNIRNISEKWSGL